ncbi:MAG: ABC transporter permease [Trueperaceae bacterium]|nr:ABC transporter permease [Trueperaceae bacterium]
MFVFIIRRLLFLPVVFFGVTIFIVLLMQFLSPTQRAATYVRSEAQLRNIDAIIDQYGLDKGPHVQYWNWLKQVLRGNWGFSKATGEPVWDSFKRRFPATFELALLSFIPTMLVGVWLGSISALNRDGIIDQISRTTSIFLWSLPTFVLAIWLLVIFYGGLGWFGLGQVTTAHSLEIIRSNFHRYTGFLTLDSLLNGRFDIFLDVVNHMILPIVTLVAIQSAQIVRIMRSSLLDTLTQDFVRTARAKGLAESIVNRKHALRNALIPIITLGGFTIVGLLNGVVITETVFAYPGMGKWLADAAVQLDTASVMAGAVFTGLLVVIANMFADVLYAVIDPRIRYN